MPTSRTLPIAALVFVMLIWGSTFVVTKAAAAEVPAVTLALLRFVVAAVVLVPMVFARGGFRRSRAMPIGMLMSMALAGMVLFTIGFNYGLVFGSATQGSLIYAVLPAAIAVAAVVFLKERPTWKQAVGIVLSIAGVALVIAAGEHGPASPHPLLGALWMLGAIIAWTVYTVLAKRLEHADQIVVITCITLLAVVMLVPLSAIELSQRTWVAPSPQAWAGIVFLGLFASAVAYVGYNYALRHLDATLVGVFTNLDPIVGVATAVLILGETLHTGHLVGGTIALAGMWLASTGDQRLETGPNAGGG